jgi:hypothetical protein
VFHVAVEQSILKSTKKILGIPADVTDFDVHIVTHINTVFMALQQLGIGPNVGFAIEDDSTTWDAFLGDDLRLNAVRTYMFLRVKLLFDPPQTSPLIEATERQVKEFEWRLNVLWEQTGWVDPTPPAHPIHDQDLILDGGTV